MDRINELTRERQELFRRASNGERGRAAVMARVHVLDAELGALWDQRRLERIGRLDGIDAVIDAAYKRTYGPKYEESFRPTPVSEPSNEPVRAAA
jgi:hypothetical protein